MSSLGGTGGSASSTLLLAGGDELSRARIGVSPSRRDAISLRSSMRAGIWGSLLWMAKIRVRSFSSARIRIMSWISDSLRSSRVLGSNLPKINPKPYDQSSREMPRRIAIPPKAAKAPLMVSDCRVANRLPAATFPMAACHPAAIDPSLCLFSL